MSDREDALRLLAEVATLEAKLEAMERAWIDGVISLEIERAALRRQVEELLAEARHESVPSSF
mgnify:CR=1 FL=1